MLAQAVRDNGIYGQAARACVCGYKCVLGRCVLRFRCNLLGPDFGSALELEVALFHSLALPDALQHALVVAGQLLLLGAFALIYWCVKCTGLQQRLPYNSTRGQGRSTTNNVPAFRLTWNGRRPSVS
jgi:hypothetical protein